ncbi:MAG: acetyl-CoA carboxylase biotin carboxyl carrier protein subunit [Proteobacteria bacterium]|nr:acetyl-CoA carboxylase biotin carboxyl carrier protein subunit [Pseudomonadota bacterium]
MKRLHITVNGRRYEVEVEVVEDDEAAAPPSFGAIGPASRHTIDSYVSPVTTPLPTRPRVNTPQDRTVTAPINGILLEIPVRVGQPVQENDVLAIVEAMKMRTNIAAPSAGVVAAIEVKVGDRVETGQVLLRFE